MKGLTPERLALKAAWVLPVSAAPIRDGLVEIADGRIVAVGPASGWHKPDVPIVDYGEAVIVPGFINLHTHLEYSALRHVNTQSALFEWIPALMSAVSAWKPEDWRRSALSGAEQLALSGTTCLVDSAYTGQAAWAAAQTGLRAMVGLELFGVDAEAKDAAWQRWLDRYGQVVTDLEQSGTRGKEALASGRVQLTVAPHSPYSVAPQLMKKAFEWAEPLKLPVPVHLAESLNECNWLANGDRQLDEFLSGRPFLSPEIIARIDWKGRGDSPCAHMERFELLSDRLLAAHCVHVHSQDIELLAKHRVGVALCPRSNARLRNGVSPLPELLAAGVRVGLGTDSQASCDDLDLLSEARFTWNLHRAINPHFSLSAAEALRHLTLIPAQILHRQDLIGSLETGKQADIGVFKLDHLPASCRQRPEESLLFGGAILCDLFVTGCKVVNKGAILMETLD